MIRQIRLLILLCSLFVCSITANAQGHMNGGNYCCPKLGGKCNTESTRSCPACKKENAAKREADLAKEKREREALAAKQKAEHEATQKALAEKARKEKEAQKRSTVSFGLPSSSSSSTSSSSTTSSSSASSSGSSSAGTASSGTASSSSSSISDPIPPAYRVTTTAQAYDQLYTAAAGLGNLLADQMVEARQRREAQRLKEWEKLEAENMKRAAEEAKVRQAARNEMEFYEPKAKRGDRYAMEQMGELHLKTKENDKAVYWLEKAAQLGSITACDRLVGSQYNFEISKGAKPGKVTITDLGMRWLDTLIARGAHEAAMKWIPVARRQSNNEKRFDLKKAIAVYERFANEGNLIAMMKMGNLYTGQSDADIDMVALWVPSKTNKNFIDGEKALLYYQMCAKAKDARLSPMALRQISKMYGKGIGIKKDAAKAAEYEAEATEMGKKLGLTFYLYAEIPFNDGTNSFTPVYTCYGLSPDQGGSPGDVKVAEDQLKKAITDQFGWTVVNVTAKETLQEALTHRATEWSKLVTADRKLFYRDDVRFIFDNRKAKPTVHPVLTASAKDPSFTTLPNGVQYKVVTTGSGSRPTLAGKVKGTYSSHTIPANSMTLDYVRRAVSWSDRKALKSLPILLAEVVAIMPAGSDWKIYIPFHLIDQKDYDFLGINKSDFGCVVLVRVEVDKVFN